MNAAVLLDTDVLSFLAKGDTRAGLYAPDVAGHQLTISFQTVAELPQRPPRSREARFDTVQIFTKTSQLHSGGAGAMIPPRPARDELLRSWAITKGHLEAACREVNAERLTQYEEWLSQNELELALDELEGIGDEEPRTRSYWQNLLAAAENMGLARHVARYRRTLDELRG